MSEKGEKSDKKRTEPDSDEPHATSPGRDQLLLVSSELQTRLGKKYCNETELLPLLLLHGLVRENKVKRQRIGKIGVVGREQLLIINFELLQTLGKNRCDEAELLPLLLARGLVRRVRTIEVEVHPIGGDSFKVTLDSTDPTVEEAKEEIACVQGTPKAQQVLYRVTVRADGRAVREDDAEPELLVSNDRLEDGELVAMSVEDSLVWRTFDEEQIELTNDRTVATQLNNNDSGKYSLVTSGIELTEGRHYCEVLIPVALPVVANSVIGIYVGVSRPNLPTVGDIHKPSCNDAWLMRLYNGGLCGNGNNGAQGCVPERAVAYFSKGDRMRVLLDLDDGSLCFFKNGVKHGESFPAGSVTAPVVFAVELWRKSQCVQLLPNA
jgi:hypothetical protein